MTQETRKLTKSSDPGHGWLSVKLEDLKTLGLTDKISSCSYMTLTRAYLEEDSDQSIFMEAAKSAGWDISIKHTHNDKTPIRNYASFDAEKVDLALGLSTDTAIKLYNSSKKVWDIKAKVIGFEDNKIIIQDEHSNMYGVSKSNFLSRTKPDTTALKKDNHAKL